MATQGKPLAAARIQGLFRGRRTRLIVTSIWKEAEEYARNIIQGEREAKLKKEAEQRTKEKVGVNRKPRGGGGAGVTGGSFCHNHSRVRARDRYTVVKASSRKKDLLLERLSILMSIPSFGNLRGWQSYLLLPVGIRTAQD